MNYVFATICGIVTSVAFGLIAPIEQLYLTWFIYLITFIGMLIFSTLEDIEDGIRK